MLFKVEPLYLSTSYKSYDMLLAGHFNPNPPRSRNTQILQPAFEANDGRAPDTAEALHQSAHKTLIRPSTQPPYDSLTSERALQSYIWFMNSCWLDMILEMLFRAIMSLPEDWVLGLQKNVSEETYLHRLLLDFSRCADWITSGSTLSQGFRILEATQAFARHWAYNTWKRYPWNAFGDPLLWVEYFLEEADVSVH